MKTAFEIIFVCLSVVNLVLSRFAFFKLRQPSTPFLWIIKVFTSALSPALFLIGLLATLSGLILSSLPLIIIGATSALVYLTHILKITRGPEASSTWEDIFSKSEKFQSNGSKSFFMPNRYVFRLPNSPEPIFNPDVPFYTIQDSNRPLLCDVWQPPKGINNSGLAFIYLHGSAWTVLDKDYGTRTFFKRLAAQGHVIMDVAYRKFPETDFMGMVHDVKHAIAWMKTNAEKYGVDSSRIVIGGGSAGAHLALLATYSNKSNQLTPLDLNNVDLDVLGVISFYGQSDLVATYYHTCQHLALRLETAPDKKDVFGGMPSWVKKRMGKDFHRLGFDKKVEPGQLVPILKGTPDEKLDAYAMFSPVTYVHGNCPSTLFLHGDHDCLAPLKAIQILHMRLLGAGVASAIHIIPQTDHAFDLILPGISPSAQNAIYDVERFLAVSAKSTVGCVLV